jgi:hypothetical protein
MDASPVHNEIVRTMAEKVARLCHLPDRLPLFAVLDGRIEEGFDFKHAGASPDLGYRHPPTKLKTSTLEDAEDLLAKVFQQDDYEEPPGSHGITAFWVQEGKFMNRRLDDLLETLDDEQLALVGVKEPQEDPMALTKARLEAELARLQEAVDKKRLELAAVEAVQQRKAQVAQATRRMAVSLKELEMATEKARSLV